MVLEVKHMMFFKDMSIYQKHPSRLAYFELVKYLYNSLQTQNGWIVLTELKSLYPLNKPISEFCYDYMVEKQHGVHIPKDSTDSSVTLIIKKLRNAYSNALLKEVEKEILRKYKRNINKDLCREWLKAILKCRGVPETFLFASYFDQHFNETYSAFSLLAIECSRLGNIEASLNAASYVGKKYDPYILDTHIAVIQNIKNIERLESYWSQLPDLCKSKKMKIFYANAIRRIQEATEMAFKTEEKTDAISMYKAS